MPKDTGLRAIKDHLQDLWRLVNFSYYNPRSLTKFRQLKSVARISGATHLIESGTYRGYTAKRCASIFEKVITIEIDEVLASKAKQFLANRSNVDVIQGDVIEILPKTLEKREMQNVLVYLDGHFSGGVTGKGGSNEPACTAIKILSTYTDRISAIIVDDFREFGKPETPKKSDLISSCERLFGGDTKLIVNFDQVIVYRKQFPE